MLTRDGILMADLGLKGGKSLTDFHPDPTKSAWPRVLTRRNGAGRFSHCRILQW